MKKELKTLSIQITGNEGEISETRLQDNGLYKSKKIGFLRLPSGSADLNCLPILFERLDEVKVGFYNVYYKKFAYTYFIFLEKYNSYQ